MFCDFHLSVRSNCRSRLITNWLAQIACANPNLARMAVYRGSSRTRSKAVLIFTVATASLLSLKTLSSHCRQRSRFTKLASRMNSSAVRAPRSRCCILALIGPNPQSLYRTGGRKWDSVYPPKPRNPHKLEGWASTLRCQFRRFRPNHEFSFCLGPSAEPSKPIHNVCAW